MAKILVIDDERAIRNTLCEILEFEGYQVDLAEDGRKGMDKLIKGNYDLVYCDVKMPEMDGIELLREIDNRRQSTEDEFDFDSPIVMISGHADIETAVEALKAGAYDFITKPVDLNRLLVTTKNALEQKSLKSKVKSQKSEVSRLKKQMGSKNQMIGESEPITRVREIINKVAPTDARVLIIGPNGTGKEVVARLLHEQSNRSTGPMIEVNCAAIPSELIESELFGHMKGSFTGAIKDRAGKFEQADGGTLFLDEIGDMSLAAQTKVLRALQESEITRVGSDKTIKVNVRVIAATNKDLMTEIQKGTFREDLYHRLCVIPIYVPALDERKEDIQLLVDHFLQLIEDEGCSAPKTFTSEAIEALKNRSWPGNIRQLRNVVERLYILSSGHEITADEVEMYA